MNKCKDCKFWDAPFDYNRSSDFGECKRLSVLGGFKDYNEYVSSYQDNSNTFTLTSDNFGCVLWEGKDD